MALSGIVMLYIIIMSGLAYRRKRESSGLMFWGMLFAAITFLNNMFGGKYYLPVGAILYLSLQAFAITSKHARSHNRVVQLSEDLQLMNKNLEVMVNDRTKELNLANKSLEKLMQSKRTLNLNAALIAGKNNNIMPSVSNRYLIPINKQTSVKRIFNFFSCFIRNKKKIYSQSK